MRPCDIMVSDMAGVNNRAVSRGFKVMISCVQWCIWWKTDYFQAINFQYLLKWVLVTLKVLWDFKRTYCRISLVMHWTSNHSLARVLFAAVVVVVLMTTDGGRRRKRVEKKKLVTDIQRKHGWLSCTSAKGLATAQWFKEEEPQWFKCDQKQELLCPPWKVWLIINDKKEDLSDGMFSSSAYVVALAKGLSSLLYGTHIGQFHASIQLYF